MTFENINQVMESVNPEDLIVGELYTITVKYSRGTFEGKVEEGEVKFLEEAKFADGTPMYRFLYTKKPEHMSSVGDSSIYQTGPEGLKWIKKLDNK